MLEDKINTISESAKNGESEPNIDKKEEVVQDIKKELFINVYGYDDVKAELLKIKSWLTNEEYLNNDKIMLPKAILFYGRPGNGKTLMLREYSSTFNAPTYVVTGESDNISEEITNIFKKAREDKFALVLIDEIDLLIGKSSRVERIIQQELDGINTKGSILVLATTNHYRDLDDALLRPGRFDRCIEIDYPDKESRKEIIRKFVKELEVDDSQVDYNHVANVCSRCSVAELKAVCNDSYLRCNKSFTTEDIEASYRRIVHNDYSDNLTRFKDFRVAIHEVGHALMALNFKDDWTFYKAHFSSTGGYTEMQESNERTDTIQKRKESIMIGMGGYIAEEVFFGKHEVGSYDDYNKIMDQCERLIERVCIKGISHVVPREYHERSDNPLWDSKLVKRNKKEVYKLLKIFERNTRKFLAKHKVELETLAKRMFENGSISYKEAIALFPNLK